MITFVLGGVRSGKSQVAEGLAAASGLPVTVIATGCAADDPDFAARIHAHRSRRPADWATIDAPHDVAAALDGTTGTALVDALGTWIANATNFAVDVDALCRALRRRVDPTIVVSDEVGLAVHAPTAAGRRFADAIGDCNQAVAALADRVLLVVAGRTVELGAS